MRNHHPFPTQAAAADRLLLELNLLDVADSRVGDGGAKVRGVSGGERRRVSVATHLFSRPMVLLLDEPTTGLDAFQALGVVEMLKTLAVTRRKTVAATLHAPRSSIFALVDGLALLSDGAVVYEGDATRALAHLEACGLSRPEDASPTDFFVDVLARRRGRPKGRSERLLVSRESPPGDRHHSYLGTPERSSLVEVSFSQSGHRR